MALIFALSATPDLGPNLGTIDLVLRKLAHVTIYAVLWLSIARATDWRRPVAATVAALLYAASDEYHQTLRRGRHGTPVDVAIDAIGIGLAALAWSSRRGGAGTPRPAVAAARRHRRARRAECYSQPRSVAMSTACARSTAPSLP